MGKAPYIEVKNNAKYNILEDKVGKIYDQSWVGSRQASRRSAHFLRLKWIDPESCFDFYLKISLIDDIFGTNYLFRTFSPYLAGMKPKESSQFLRQFWEGCKHCFEKFRSNLIYKVTISGKKILLTKFNLRAVDVLERLCVYLRTRGKIDRD